MKFDRKPQFRCLLFNSAGTYWIIIYYIKYNNIFILVHRIKYRLKPYRFFFILVFAIILVLHFAETTVMLCTSFVFIACLALYATSMAQAFQTQRYNYNCGPRRNATGRRLTWTGAEYQFECDTVDALLRDSGQYVPRNNIALRAQISGDDLYLAYPRWMMHLLAFTICICLILLFWCVYPLLRRLRSGVPATVVTTPLLDDTCGATMTPYPCLSVQEQGKSGDVQNAVDIYLDSQNILWVLDTGIVQTLDNVAGPQRTGPPVVWAFDLNTRKV